MSGTREEIGDYTEAFTATLGPQRDGSELRRDLTERLEKPMADLRLLQTAASGLRAVLSRVFFETPLRPVKNFLNGTWLEHPLHPVLTDVPIGGWTSALALDVASLVFGVKRIGKASAIATGVGTAGGLAATVSGLMDYIDLDGPDMVVALVHGVSNISATALFGASLVERRNHKWKVTPRAFALSVLGYLTVIFGGYVGGSLVFRRGVMVNRNAFRAEPQEFTRVIAFDDLPENEPKRVQVKGNPVMLLRRGEQVYALCAVCAHLGGPLDEGRIDGDEVECPWHGSRFALHDGSVRAGPTTAPVPTYETRVESGQVQIKMRR